MVAPDAVIIRPGAVPAALGRTTAPRGTMACRADQMDICLPRDAYFSFKDSITPSSSSRSRLSARQTASRVTSSIVGPRPPVTMTRSNRRRRSSSTLRLGSSMSTRYCE